MLTHPLNDLFISYNTADRSLVEQVAHSLRRGGVTLFLDRYSLAAGSSWVDDLERELAQCRCSAVFVGPNGLGGWQRRERAFLLNRQAREASFAVIPVLLPGAGTPPGFLALNTWIDMRDGIVDEALQNLIGAIRGEPPAPDFEQKLNAAKAGISPYRGLESFQEEDEPFFFGRESYTDAATKALSRTKLLAIVGSSGSGKSSLVRAGLLPRLRRQHDGQVWEVVSLVPQDQPFHSLAAAFLPLLEQSMTEVDRLTEIEHLALRLRQGKIRLRHVIERALEKQRGTNRLLLFVDQWEELYALCHDDETRKHFVDHIVEASSHSRTSIALTIRGDFYGHAIADRSLSDLFQSGLINIGPMQPNEIREAIEGPASTVGLRFEDGLVDRILQDLGDDTGNLPLLEFLLSELWHRRSNNTLLHQAYSTLGGVRGAIAKRAEQAFERLSDEEQRLARGFLVQLVRPGEGTEDTRRRALLADQRPAVRQLATRLANERLLVTSNDSRGRETVEFAHETLISEWKRLRNWLDEDREFLRLLQRLESEALTWIESNQPPDLLLPAGRRLAEATEALSLQLHPIRTDVRQYIVTSLDAEQQRQADADRAYRRRLWITKATAAALGTLLLISAAATFVAYLNYGEATRERDQAVIYQSENLARIADEQIAAGNLDLAILLALEGLPTPEDPTKPFTYHPAVALSDAVLAYRQIDRAKAHDSRVASVAYSPDGSSIVAASDDKTAKILGLDGTTAATLQHEALVRSAAFSLDGTKILTVSDDHTARIWDRGGKHLATLRHNGPVTSGEFSADGRSIISASKDKTARVWNVDGTLLSTLRHEDWVEFAALSADGTTAITHCDDAVLRIWNVRDAQAKTIRHERRIVHAAMSRDGTSIVTADQKTVRLWDAQGRQLQSFSHEENIIHTAISDDGAYFLTVTNDAVRVWRQSGESVITLKAAQSLKAFFGGARTRVVTITFSGLVRIWELSGTLIATFQYSPTSDDSGSIVPGSLERNVVSIWSMTGESKLGSVQHQGTLYSAAFSPDGTFVVTASADKTAKVWDTKSHVNATLQHEAAVYSAKFSLDGALVVTASEDRTARIWNTKATQLTVLRHNGAVYDASFSPDKSRILSASEDRTARLWDPAGRMLHALDHDGPVYAARFSPDGQTIATASWDRTARLWDINGSLIATLRHDAIVAGVEFSADNTRLLTYSWDGTVKIWGASRGEEIGILKLEKRIRSASFDHTGTRILAYAGEEVTLWSTSGDLLTHLKMSSFNSATFAVLGEKILTTEWRGTVRVWSLAGETIAVIRDEIDTNFALVSPNGDLLLLAEKQEASAVRNEEGSDYWTTFYPDSGIISAALNPAGDRIVTGATDGSVLVWDATARDASLWLTHDDRVNSARFSRSGRRIVTASDDKTARIWYPSGQLLRTFRHSKSVKSAVFSPNERTILTTSGEEAYLWDIDGRLSATLRHDGEIYSALFSEDGKLVITASWDRSARIWSNGGELLQTLFHDEPVRLASVSPQGTTRFATVSGSTVSLWDSAGRRIRALDHGARVSFMSFSPDGSLLVTVSDKQVTLYDNRGELREKYEASSFVTAARFVSNSQMITKENDGPMHVWDLNTMQRSILYQLRGHRDFWFARDIGCLASVANSEVWILDQGRQIATLKLKGYTTTGDFSPNGQYIVASGGEKKAHLWRAICTLDELTQTAKTLVGRTLTKEERRRFSLN